MNAPRPPVPRRARARGGGALRRLRVALGLGAGALAHHVAGRRAPLSAVIALTDACTARCGYCDIPARGRPGLSTVALLRLLDELAEAGCRRVGFWGGEPLLRADLPVLLGRARRLGLWTSLDTNGHLLPRRVDDLADLDHLVVSLDGGPAAHDAARGAGTHARAMAGIEAAAAAGIPLWTLTVLSRHNLGDLDLLLSLAERIGGRAAFQVLHHPAGLAGDGAAAFAPEPAAQRAALQWLLDAQAAGRPVAVSAPALRQLRDWPDLRAAHRFDPRLPACLAGQLWVNVDPDGRLHACSLWPDRAGAPDVVAEGFGPAFARLTAPPCRACLATCFTELQGLLRFEPGALAQAAAAALPRRLAPRSRP